MSAVGENFLQVLEESKRRLAAPSDPLSPGLREWLIRGGNYVVTKSSNSTLQVTSLDNSCVVANGADVARFLWAARESIVPRSATIYDPRSTAWAFVALYYTGFFMAHALLRMFGFGVIFLSNDDRTLLSAAPGVSSKLDRGAYRVVIEAGSKFAITLSKTNGSGVHESFWRSLDSDLQLIANNIAAGGGYLRAFSASLLASAALETEDLRLLFGNPNNQSFDVGWMSTLRNDINYRFGRNVWAPGFRMSGVAVERLRDDVIGMVRDSRRTLGAKLKLDADMKEMVDRVCSIYRGFSLLHESPLPI